MNESAQPPPPGISSETNADMEAWGKLVNEVSADYRRESDRAAVVLAVSRLDYELGQALKGLLVDDKLLAKKFRFGAFQNFSDRIDLAYGLGFLSKHLYADMNALRELRNHFAHHHKHADFSDEEAKRIFAKMHAPKAMLKQGLDVRNSFFLSIASALFVVRVNMRPKTRPVVPFDFDLS